MDYELLEKSITPLVDSQFPSFYFEEGPLFIKFVKEYYTWMETSFPSANTRVDTNGTVSIGAKSANVVGRNTSFDSYFSNGDQIAIYIDDNNYNIYTIESISNSQFITLSTDTLPHVSASNCEYRIVNTQKNPLYYSRRLLDNHDVDIAEDEFILLFKEKYLKDIQFNTIIDIRKFIKHSLDLYRSKGTERSIDLLYKSVFGVPAKVYYPSKDIFTLSSGKWYIPKYLELSLNDKNFLLQNKQITGASSGATAFVDAIIRKTIKNKIIDVAYISAINGNFIYGEKIQGADINLFEAPVMIGSLNSVRIPEGAGGQDFVIGDIVDITANNGIGAKGRITEVANSQGTLSYTLLEGGYGYSIDANVLVSDYILTLKNVVANNANYYFELFEGVTQPLANLNYINSNGNFTEGANLYTYYANNQLKGTGKVLQVSLANSSAGILTISVLSGNMNSAAIYSQANAIAANLTVSNGYSNSSASANVLGYYANGILYIGNTVGNFTLGETVIQNTSNATGKVTGITSQDSNVTFSVGVSNITGAFISNQNIVGQTSNSLGKVLTQTIYVGVINTSANGFVSYSNNYFYGNSVTGEISSISQGSGGDLEVTDLSYTETVNINTDLLIDYANVALNANQYGFPANVTGNATSHVIYDLITYVEKDIGVVNGIRSVSFGANYNRIPIIKLYDEFTYKYGGRMHDTVHLQIGNPTGGFEVGELVTQQSSNARGIVLESNSSVVTVKRMRYYANNQFVLTSNSQNWIEGQLSGSLADIQLITIDELSEYYGIDADIEVMLTAANGVAKTVKILDSGFGYNEVDELTLTSENNNMAYGFGNLETIGTGTGFHKTKDGFLSSSKMLFDGLYYQHYSYDVKSSIINNYKKKLKEIVHVAGTKYFDTLDYDTNIPVNIGITSEKTIT